MSQDELERKVESEARRLLAEFEELVNLSSALPRDRLEAIGERIKPDFDRMGARLDKLFPEGEG